MDVLRKIAKKRKDVDIYEGNCNDILLDKVFERARYKEYRRALCILDPYGLHLDWKVMEKAGKMKSIEIFLNFPISDMNRNVLRRKNPRDVSDDQIQRLNSFWGDESWKEAAYGHSSQLDLFEPRATEKEPNKVIAEAFRKRLEKSAKFKFVLEPLPMRNSKKAVIYYLFFASQKPVAEKIVKDIFNKYRNKEET